MSQSRGSHRREARRPTATTPRQSFTGGIRDATRAEKLSLVVALALSIWWLVQLAANYPNEFFPRFADEGIYALDARVPKSIFDEHKPLTVRYAPAKLGYGIPLAVSVILAGQNGAMYLSTLSWALAIALIGVLAFRSFGPIVSVLTVAGLVASPLFGKYVCEVGPTAWVSLAFVAYWAAACTRRVWLIGLSIGLLSFIDFKWAVPAGLSYCLIEFLIEGRASFKVRVMRVLAAGGIGLLVIAVAVVIHNPYGKFLAEYVFPHGGLMKIAPSPVFLWYCVGFGAAVPMLLTPVSLTIPETRALIAAWDLKSGRAASKALVIALVPIIFYSLFGELKAVRFFAPTFPLLIMLAALSLSAVLHWIGNRSQTPNLRPALRAIASMAAVAMVGVALYGNGDGPAHHLALKAGYEEALASLRSMNAKGSISSYNWPVVAYGWPEPFPGAPFAYIGLQSTDQWVILDSALDRTTIELRLALGADTSTADSVWNYQREQYLRLTDSVFSLLSEFNASLYFRSEMATTRTDLSGLLECSDENVMTVRRINLQKIKAFQEQ